MVLRTSKCLGCESFCGKICQDSEDHRRKDLLPTPYQTFLEGEENEVRERSVDGAQEGVDQSAHGSSPGSSYRHTD